MLMSKNVNNDVSKDLPIALTNVTFSRKTYANGLPFNGLKR